MGDSSRSSLFREGRGAAKTTTPGVEKSMLIFESDRQRSP
jgi:hypothetical protein